MISINNQQKKKTFWSALLHGDRLYKILIHKILTHKIFTRDFLFTFLCQLLVLFSLRELPSRKRKPKIIVSLTSIPSRFGFLSLALESIFRQSILPNKIVLWLSPEYTNFPNYPYKKYPESLNKLIKRGLEIHWTEDIGSYRKLIPSLKQFPKDIIITVDDDIFYPKNTIETLYNAYLNHGDTFVYCRRSIILEYHTNKKKYHRKQFNFSTQNNHKNCFFTTGGGTLFPPNILHKEVFNKKIFQKLAPFEDDTWFNAMCRLNNKKVFQVNSQEIRCLPSANKNALKMINNRANKQEMFYKQLHDVFDYYKLIPES